MINKKASQSKWMQGKKIITFCLDEEKDKDILEQLEKCENKSEAIREALREIRMN